MGRRALPAEVKRARRRESERRRRQNPEFRKKRRERRRLMTTRKQNLQIVDQLTTKSRQKEGEKRDEVLSSQCIVRPLFLMTANPVDVLLKDSCQEESILPDIGVIECDESQDDVINDEDATEEFVQDENNAMGLQIGESFSLTEDEFRGDITNAALFCKAEFSDSE